LTNLWGLEYKLQEINTYTTVNYSEKKKKKKILNKTPDRDAE
jgi:hypothetical protein